MFPVTKGRPAGQVDAGRARSELLQRAAQERLVREKAALNKGHALTVLRFIRGSHVRIQTARDLRINVTKKCSDLSAVNAIFASKNIPFVPPPAALLPIVASLTLAHKLVPLDFRTDGALVLNLARWVHRALLSGSLLLTQATSVPVLRRMLSLFKECLLQRAVLDNKLILLDCMSLCAGLPSLSSISDSVPVARVALTSAGDAVGVQQGMHEYLRQTVRFAAEVARPLCFATTEPAAGGAPNDAALLASRAVELSIILAQTTQIGAVIELSGVVGIILTVPWLMLRLAGTHAHASLPFPALLDTLISCAVAHPPVLMGAHEHAHMRIRTRTQREEGKGAKASCSAEQLQRSDASSGRQSDASSGRQSDAAASSPSAGSAVAFMPTTNIATIFANPKSQNTGGSFFDSQAARAALADMRLRDHAREDTRQMCCWPSEWYLLGNLLTMCADPLPRPPEQYEFSAADAAVAREIVGPVLAGSAWPALAYLPAPSVCRALTLFADLMRTGLPANQTTGDQEGWEGWGQSTPVTWVTTPGQVQGDGLGAGTGPAKKVPVPMPAQLIAQLRRLSSERLAKASAALLLRPRIPSLRLPRLRLAAHEDPERGSYDDSDAYGITPGARMKAGSGSNLAAAATGLSSLLRAAWSTSKLAMSLFSRRKPGAMEVVQTAPSLSTTVPLEAISRSQDPGNQSSFEDDHVLAFCRLYSDLLAPRSSGGSLSKSDGAVDPIVSRMYLLRSLAFHPSLCLPHVLWLFIADRLDISTWLTTSGYKGACTPSGAWGVLTTFAAVMSHAVLVVDDYELYEGVVMSTGSCGGGSQVLTLLPPLREIRHAVRLLRDTLAHVEGIGADEYLTPACRSSLAAPASAFWSRFASMATGILRSLYERHCQRPQGPQSMWQIDPDGVALTIARTREEIADGVSDRDVAIRRMLARIPFAVPFVVRAAIFEQTREADRRANQEGQPQVKVSVQRSRLFETTYAALRDVRGPLFKRKLYVTFENEAGVAEAGIDAGGLFKELWTELAKVVFHPGYGLWATTEAGDLYPNPMSALCAGLDNEESFTFLGRVTGKALYEGITVGPRWSRFWLAQLLGRQPNLHDLPSLDPDLYKSLMFLRTCPAEDVSDLCLSFTITPDLGGGGGGGGSEEIELLPGGATIEVTAANRLQYIHLVAQHRLRTSIARQTDSFLRGLHEVLPAAWLAQFSPPELQVLASGSTGGIDVADLKAHAQYAGGYGSRDRVILDFWAVLESLSQRDRAAVLRFVTSCERPPPLGFKQLEPRFTILRVAIRRDDEALPMSSTCFHILKLPQYSKREVLKEKLMLAIHSGAGFELS